MYTFHSMLKHCPVYSHCSEEDCQTVARLLTAHAAQYSNIQKAFKAAALQRRQNAAKQADTDRQQLLGSPEAAMRRRQMATDADVVGASEGITDSLRRTRQMIAEVIIHCLAQNIQYCMLLQWTFQYKRLIRRSFPLQFLYF